MRYSRMNRKPPKRRSKYAGLIIVVVILGVAAYFVGAGAAGGWLARNVIDPVMGSGESSAASPSAGMSDAGADPEASDEMPMQAINLPENSGERSEDTISAEEISLFALQTGAFTDEANAKEAATLIIARGGAGYIAYDGELYRVLVAGYTDNANALSVKQTLLSDDVKTSVFNLKSESLEFKIGAEQDKIDVIKACFDCVPDTVSALQQIIFDSDNGKNVDNDITVLKQNVTDVAARFNSTIASDEPAIQRLGAYMQSFDETINGIPQSTAVTEVEFSSQLKYNLISIVVDYAAFLEELRN